MAAKKQIEMIKNEGSRYGGSLLKTRRGRSRGRPLSTSKSMHIVMRSDLAKGSYSLRNYKHEIQKILKKFASKYHVKIYSFANVGNHLHLNLKLSNRRLYFPFIRAISSAIMMKVTGVSRWAKENPFAGKRFWSQRPFSRILTSYKERLFLKDYIQINQLEGLGYTKGQAKFIYHWNKAEGTS